MLEGCDFTALANSIYCLTHPELLHKINAARRARRAASVIVLAIKPKYAKAIYEGRKNWEFRKAPPPLYREMYVYESAPVSAVTGTIIFGESVTGIPLAVMDMVKTNRCFTRNLPRIAFDDLATYAGKNLVTALRVMEAKRFDKPVAFNPKPPQNWARYYIGQGSEAPQ